MEALTRGPGLSVTGKEGEGGDRRGLSIGKRFGPSAWWGNLGPGLLGRARELATRGGGRSRPGRGDLALAKGHQAKGKNTRGLARVFLFFFSFFYFPKHFHK